MDVVTDLLDDDLDVARRRTVIAHVSALDPRPLQPVLERQVAAVLAGRHSPDDGAAVVPALRLPPRYLIDPLVTREVNRQTTLMLLIKAARLHGVGNFKICRTSMGDDPTAAPDTRIPGYYCNKLRAIDFYSVHHCATSSPNIAHLISRNSIHGRSRCAGCVPLPFLPQATPRSTTATPWASTPRRWMDRMMSTRLVEPLIDCGRGNDGCPGYAGRD